MRQSITTRNAPDAIGPYSQGIAANSFVYTSGQLPIDMTTGKLELSDIQKATEYCLRNICAILETKGLSMEDIVKTTVFLTDLNDFSAMNEVYATFFTGEPPARSCVQVAALPKGVKIEIEAVAAQK